MSSTLLLLGPIRFSVSSTAYDNLSRSSRWDWKAVDRVGEMPALQYTGPQNDTITLAGRLVPPLTGGTEQMYRMRMLADTGYPMPLITGTGLILGLWVIESIEDTGTNHFKDGYPRLTTFNITLKQYMTGVALISAAYNKAKKAINLFG